VALFVHGFNLSYVRLCVCNTISGLRANAIGSMSQMSNDVVMME
jgi:hypothetical protein